MVENSGEFHGVQLAEYLTTRPKCPQNPDLNCTKDYGPFVAFPDLLEDDLDCLNLNVYCPTARAGEPLPVLVWIHGYVCACEGLTHEQRIFKRRRRIRSYLG
jgi:hypothetical protein